MQPVITIFCAFTRRWAIDGWLDNLANVKHEPSQTNLCIIVDCDEPYIANMAKKFAEERNYRSFHVKINSNWQPNETRLSIRRMRVADVHNQSKDLIALTDGEIIIGLEDDTVFDRLESFEPLYQYLLNNDAAYVEGVQMGRWGANIIGAWVFDDPHNPKEVKTLLPRTDFAEGESHTDDITGGGFYGYATKRWFYMNHEYYTSSAQPWGPDVNYGLWLKQQGQRCLVNWDVVYGHNDYNMTLYPDDPKVRLTQIVYNKNEITGKWDRSDHEQTRY